MNKELITTDKFAVFTAKLIEAGTCPVCGKRDVFNFVVTGGHEFVCKNCQVAWFVHNKELK